MLTPHSSDFEQLAAIGAVRYLRSDRPTAPPFAGGDEPGWVRTMPFPCGESAEHRVPAETPRAVHIWVQVAPMSLADLGLARQALWSLHPSIELACPDPDGRLLRIALAGGTFTPIRDWIRAIVALPLVALHASRSISSVLIGLERG
ncbi:MAG: hypothetical protein IPL61_00945 [Myxococcales bacterium]|nr:hypothetical protein [Myxococcales bacterium]